MSKSKGPSAGELDHAGAFSGVAMGDKAPDVRAAEGTGAFAGASETHSMLNVGKQEVPCIGGPGMDSAIKLGGSMAELFNYFTKAGGALGASISECFGKMANYFGTDEAKGDTISIEHLGAAEAAQPFAGVQGDLGLAGKGAGFRTQQAGQEH